MITKDTLFIYTRVSTLNQSDKGHSLAAQKKVGIEKAQFLNMNHEIFEEKGVSASTEFLEKRIEIRKLLDMCDEGIVKHIFVTELDRLTRNQTTQLLIKKILMDNGVILHTVNHTIDLKNNDEDEFMTDLTALLSIRENKLRVKRSIRGKLEAVRKGGWKGGWLPYGYTTDENKKLIIDDEESIIYRDMVKLSLEGFGVRLIAVKLNEKDIKTRKYKLFKKKNENQTGNKHWAYDKLEWQAASVLHILKNPLYMGERLFKGNVFSAPALIDKDTWKKLQKNFQKNKTYSSRNNTKNFYLLKNLIYCGCGKKMYGMKKEKKHMILYYCSSFIPRPHKNPCGMRSINLYKIEKLVWENVVNILGNSKFVNKQFKQIFSKKRDVKKNQNEIKLLKQHRKIKEDERKRIITLYGKNQIKIEDVDEISEKLNKEIETIESKIILKKGVIDLERRKSEYGWLVLKEEKVEFLKNDISEEKKRKVLNILLESITVEYLEEFKEHIITIKMRLPLLHKSKNSVEFLLDGTYIPDNINDNIVINQH